MTRRIVPLSPEYEAQVLELSLRSWAPVFEKLAPPVPSDVYETFYPQGWRVRQATDIAAFLKVAGELAWVAVEEGAVLGWLGARLHSENSMGEIYILAVDPNHSGAVWRQAQPQHEFPNLAERPDDGGPGLWLRGDPSRRRLRLRATSWDRTSALTGRSCAAAMARQCFALGALSTDRPRHGRAALSRYEDRHGGDGR